MVMMVNRSLVSCHDVKAIGNIDHAAIKTHGKYIQTQKQRKDRSDFSDHVWILNYETPPANTKAVDQCRSNRHLSNVPYLDGVVSVLLKDNSNPWSPTFVKNLTVNYQITNN